MGAWQGGQAGRQQGDAGRGVACGQLLRMDTLHGHAAWASWQTAAASPAHSPYEPRVELPDCAVPTDQHPVKASRPQAARHLCRSQRPLPAGRCRPETVPGRGSQAVWIGLPAASLNCSRCQAAGLLQRPWRRRPWRRQQLRCTPRLRAQQHVPRGCAFQCAEYTRAAWRAAGSRAAIGAAGEGCRALVQHSNAAAGQAVSGGPAAAPLGLRLGLLRALRPPEVAQGQQRDAGADQERSFGCAAPGGLPRASASRHVCCAERVQADRRPAIAYESHPPAVPAAGGALRLRAAVDRGKGLFTKATPLFFPAPPGQ